MYVLGVITYQILLIQQTHISHQFDLSQGHQNIMLLRIVICFLALQNTSILLVEAIFGGEYGDSHEFPWIVKLNMDNCKHKFCGGSIISENIILTAAHCVDRGLLDRGIPIQ